MMWQVGLKFMKLLLKVKKTLSQVYRPSMASEIFGTAAIFWVLIPIGLLGGALLLKLEGD